MTPLLCSTVAKNFISLCALLLFVNALAFAEATATNPSDQQSCSALAHLKTSTWSVESAEVTHAPFTVGNTEQTVTVLESFCRVVGRGHSEAASDIGFELWLPAKNRWNGKFAGVGSGGSLGAILYRDLTREMLRGYATVATDNGHRSEAFDVSWALGHPERIADFGYRAQHLVTQAGKELTQKFYSTQPKHSYFIGCSQGGHHGLTEAQRFPEDYDGIVAGAPVYDWSGEMTEQAWNVRALQRTPHGFLPVEKLQTLYNAVAKACAGPDGLIDDPRQCSFDPATLKCKAEDSNSCLIATEIEAVRALYQGPKTSTGKLLYPGLARGSEHDWDVLWSDSKHLGGSWEGFYRFMIFGNPNWNLSTINFDLDPALAKRKVGATMNPDNPDLKAFADRGGKLIVYHGWSDDMVPSQVSIDYWNAVRRKMGPVRVNDFYRLFMVPGMAHCGGGVGADELFHTEKAAIVPIDPDHDMLTALENWIERGKAPESFTASRVNQQGALERTRLLCPYPGKAKYQGQGDVMQAANFTCSTSSSSPCVLQPPAPATCLNATIRLHFCDLPLNMQPGGCISVQSYRTTH